MMQGELMFPPDSPLTWLAAAVGLFFIARWLLTARRRHDRYTARKSRAGRREWPSDKTWRDE